MRTIKKGVFHKDKYKSLIGEQVKCTSCGCVAEIESRDDIQKKLFNSGTMRHWSTICPECGAFFVVLIEKIEKKKKQTFIKVVN